MVLKRTAVTTPQVKARLTEAYLTAREYIVAAGYGEEIDWQDSRDFNRLTESEFLREAAWVVLNAGMSEAVIRRLFGRVSEAFLNWSSARKISIQSEQCVMRARHAFAHERKAPGNSGNRKHCGRGGLRTFQIRIGGSWAACAMRTRLYRPCNVFSLGQEHWSGFRES